MSARVWPTAAVSGSPLYDGRALRQTTVAPFVGGATAARPLGARDGVRPGTSTTTVTATSTVWTVNPHAGVIDAESANEAGPYAYSFDAAVTGSMTAADPSNPRIDVVFVRIDDPAESDGSSTPVAAIGYQAGTPAAIPAAPTTWTGSARCMVLAQISVPKVGGGSPSVVWIAPTLAAAGGITPSTAAAFGAGSYVGQYIDDPALGLLRWNGTVWKPQSYYGDTGPIALVLASGVTVSSGFTPTIECHGGIVYLSGQATTTGASGNVAAIPAAYLPRRDARIAGARDTSGQTTGVVLASRSSAMLITAIGVTINLDGISWPAAP